jgi:uncharacterized protein YraI
MSRQVTVRLSLVFAIALLVGSLVLIRSKPAFASSCGQTSVNQPTYALAIGYISGASAANVRTGPGTDCGIITTQPANINVIYTGTTSGSWSQVFYYMMNTQGNPTSIHYDAGHVGWIANSLLTRATHSYRCMQSTCYDYATGTGSLTAPLSNPTPNCSLFYQCEAYASYGNEISFTPLTTGTDSSWNSNFDLNFWQIGSGSGVIGYDLLWNEYVWAH